MKTVRTRKEDAMAESVGIVSGSAVGKNRTQDPNCRRVDREGRREWKRCSQSQPRREERTVGGRNAM